jgi:hypothetical protein
MTQLANSEKKRRRFVIGVNWQMPQFFFHVRCGAVRFEDRHGGEFANLQAAWNWALCDARHVIDDEALDARANRYWIEICDSTGSEVAALPFARVLSLH